MQLMKNIGIEVMRLNECLPCAKAGCGGRRHGWGLLCQEHVTREMAARRDRGRRAAETRRARYPDRYAPKAPGQAAWQSMAQQAVAKAKKAGILPDLSTGAFACVDCGKPATVYEHRDYSRPLDVEPVCGGCNARRGCAKYPQQASFVRLPPSTQPASTDTAA